MITECPSCGSTDLDHERGTCNKCGLSFEDESPAASSVSSLPALIHTPLAAPVSPPAPVAEPTTEPHEHETVQQLAAAQNEEDWQRWEEVVVKAWEEGFRIVTLIGFSGAGKSFFANRLRRQLRLHPDWSVWPGEIANIPKSDNAIEWTEIVRHKHGHQRYLLADVDGEAYRASVVRLLGQTGTTVQRRYVLLTALASSFLLMIPAREDLYQKDEAETGRLVDRFDVIVGVILALQRRMQGGGNVRDNLKREVTEADSRQALRDAIRCPQPLEVLFAQADEFADVAVQDADPYLFAARSAGSLFRTVEKHFPVHRFDFVSAFVGYEPNTTSAVDYRRASYGTLAAWEWIDGMTSPPRLLAPWRQRATTAAKWTRVMLDGDYRRAVAMAGR